MGWRGLDSVRSRHAIRMVWFESVGVMARCRVSSAGQTCMALRDTLACQGVSHSLAVLRTPALCLCRTGLPPPSPTPQQMQGITGALFHSSRLELCDLFQLMVTRASDWGHAWFGVYLAN